MTKTQCKCGWLVFNASSAIVIVKCPQCGTDIKCEAGPGKPKPTAILGLGDYIALFTRYTGIAWLTKRLTRGKCGCARRQAQANAFGTMLRGWFVRLIRRAR